MTAPRRPPSIESIGGRSLAGTAVAAIGTTFLFVGTTIAALTAAGAVDDGTLLTPLAALFAGLATIAVALAGARFADRRIAVRFDRSRRSSAGDRRR